MSEIPAEQGPDEWTPERSEIERLRWWLEHIRNMRDRPAIELREAADNALNGDAQGA